MRHANHHSMDGENLAVSLADNIQDTAPQGEPHKLLKLIVRSSSVFYLPFLHHSRCVRSVGVPDFHILKERADAVAQSLCAAGLLVEQSNLQILVDRTHMAASLPGGHIDFEH